MPATANRFDEGRRVRPLELLRRFARPAFAESSGTSGVRQQQERYWAHQVAARPSGTSPDPSRRVSRAGVRALRWPPRRWRPFGGPAHITLHCTESVNGSILVADSDVAGLPIHGSSTRHQYVKLASLCQSCGQGERPLVALTMDIDGSLPGCCRQDVLDGLSPERKALVDVWGHAAFMLGSATVRRHNACRQASGARSRPSDLVRPSRGPDGPGRIVAMPQVRADRSAGQGCGRS